MNAGDNSLRYRSVAGTDAADALERVNRFLREHSDEDLLALVGETVPSIALRGEAADKTAFPRSYGGGTPCGGDLLAARGLFFVTQAGKVMLDCTGGHYQMNWGYNHPELNAAAQEALELGIVWDNHANLTPMPVKLLARRLAELGAESGLNRVHLGTATGSVACSAALKIMLIRHLADSARKRLGTPVLIALAGNYHGNDFACQAMRGMWPGLVAGLEPAQVEPNDPNALQDAFRRFGRRVAGFWAEPVMMNREAIRVEGDYLALARELCTGHGALMALDEIQTGFWYPEVFSFRRLGIRPDIVVAGKGMTSGFHPQAAILYREELDVLEQYDAISTNGTAALPCWIGLCNLRMLERERSRLANVERRHFEGLTRLAAEFPEVVERVNGCGLLTGLRFRTREDAIGFHKAAVERGLWVRVHVYHPGHRTVLSKFPLVADDRVIDYVHSTVSGLLKEKPWSSCRTAAPTGSRSARAGSSTASGGSNTRTNRSRTGAASNG